MMEKQFQRDRLFKKIHYPGSYLLGTSLNESTIRAIIKKQYSFLEKLRKIIRETTPECYDRDYLAYCSYYDCWRGVEHFLNGIRDWDRCMGVNNPYLMSSSLIKDKFKCYGITISTYKNGEIMRTVHEFKDKESAMLGKKRLKTENPVYAIHYLPDGLTD